MKKAQWNHKPALFATCLVTSLLLWSTTAAQSNIYEPEYGAGFVLVDAKKFIFNPRTLQWTAMNGNTVVRTGHGSAGRSYCPDTRRGCRTPSGTFHVISKGGASCRSSRYPLGRGGAPMPYCMFFTQYYGVHGSYDVPNYNASHGCIRVPVKDAKWLYNNFMEIGTPVVVKPY